VENAEAFSKKLLFRSSTYFALRLKNVFIAVIVDSITADKEQDRKDHAQFNAIEQELRIVHRELSELKHLLQQQSAPPPPRS
jgi:hypothetical protein